MAPHVGSPKSHSRCILALRFVNCVADTTLRGGGNVSKFQLQRQLSIGIVRNVFKIGCKAFVCREGGRPNGANQKCEWVRSSRDSSKVQFWSPKRDQICKRDLSQFFVSLFLCLGHGIAVIRIARCWLLGSTVSTSISYLASVHTKWSRSFCDTLYWF